ncbi:MAG: leucine-rich repeat domain-containing protein [Sodaliphilus sp.]|nr:leucine-rich repeat domain-containing protein [Bacteroidales bacterium]MDY5706765.1 leucine-rich repeat domain-containing protein [Sodaliphilus sp.]
MGCKYYGCGGLTSIVIPDGVTRIGKGALSGCTGLNSLIVGKNNQYYCSESNCILSKDRTSLIVGCNNSIIPDGITRIDKAAFDGCTGLISLKIPDSVTEIGELAFYECTGLESIEIPDRVTVIGRLAFDGCTGLTSIKIPDSVTEIGEGVFSGCNGLTSIVIPDSVTEIGDSAFAYNTGLTSLEIPGSITEIGYDAFYGCPNLKDVFIDAKQSSTIEFLLETIPQRKRITLHVPVESEYADLHGEAIKGFKAVVAEKWK